MSRQELARLRKELKRQLKDLAEELAKKRDLITERSRDPVDEVQSEISVALAATAINIEWETCRAIEAALDRIHSHDYGICESCWEPISPKRLQAIPWATLCVACRSCQEAEKSPSVSVGTLPKSHHGDLWTEPLWTALGF